MQARGTARRGASMTMMAIAALAVSAVMVLTSCAGTIGEVTPPVDAEPKPASSSPSPTPEPELTVEDIVAAVSDGEWSFAGGGLDEPFAVTLTAGVATDDFGRSYSLGEAIAGDANGDGVVDAVIPISQLDGNAVHQLWYIWLGGSVGEAPEQVIYPISRGTRCGDITRSVTAVEAGFQVDIVLRMPYTDDARSCAEGGTGELTRVVSVTEVDGEWFPVQTAPVAAWGGVCPPTQWLDGVEEIGISGRAAPPASAPVVTDPDRSIGLFALGDAPLVTAGGVSFFGFIQGDVDAPVKMHCAFAD